MVDYQFYQLNFKDIIKKTKQIVLSVTVEKKCSSSWSWMQFFEAPGKIC